MTSGLFLISSGGPVAIFLPKLRTTIRFRYAHDQLHVVFHEKDGDRLRAASSGSGPSCLGSPCRLRPADGSSRSSSLGLAARAMPISRSAGRRKAGCRRPPPASSRPMNFRISAVLARVSSSTRRFLWVLREASQSVSRSRMWWPVRDVLPDRQAGKREVI